MSGQQDINQRKAEILDALSKSDSGMLQVRFLMNGRQDIGHRALRELMEEGFASGLNSGTLVKITYEGKDIAKAGYMEYVKEQIEQQELQEQDIKLERQKAQLEVKQLTFLEKTKWWPHIISLISLIVAVVALVVSLKGSKS